MGYYHYSIIYVKGYKFSCNLLLYQKNRYQLVTYTSVTMAAKSHLRNNRPVVIGISTNDALGAAAKNIGALLNYKNYYFVPFGMDNFSAKPKSMVCDFEQVKDTIEKAEKGEEILKKIY